MYRFDQIKSLRTDIYDILGGVNNIRLVECRAMRPQELKITLRDGSVVDYRNVKLCSLISKGLLRAFKIRKDFAFIEFQNHIEARWGYEALKVDR